jgi:hypothetical protein
VPKVSGWGWGLGLAPRRRPVTARSSERGGTWVLADRFTTTSWTVPTCCFAKGRTLTFGIPLTVLPRFTMLRFGETISCCGLLRGLRSAMLWGSPVCLTATFAGNGPWAMCRQHDFRLLLLQNGANAEIRDHDGRTPLHWATDNPSLETLTILIKQIQGANVNVTDASGRCTRVTLFGSRRRLKQRCTETERADEQPGVVAHRSPCLSAPGRGTEQA